MSAARRPGASLRLHRDDRRRLHRRRLLDLRGHLQGRRQSGRQAQTAHRTGRDGPGAWAWPANRRILYNRASADPEGKPWSERKKLVWWDEEKGRWVGADEPDFPLEREPSAHSDVPFGGPSQLDGDDPFIMQADGKGWLFAPSGMVDGPPPTHYEPQESGTSNPLYTQQNNPRARSCVARTTCPRPVPASPAPRSTPTCSRPTGSPSTTRPAACHGGCPTSPSSNRRCSARSHRNSPRNSASSRMGGRHSSPHAERSRPVSSSPSG